MDYLIVLIFESWCLLIKGEMFFQHNVFRPTITLSVFYFYYRFLPDLKSVERRVVSSVRTSVGDKCCSKDTLFLKPHN